MRVMIADRTSASSGLMTRSRSASVLDGAMASRGDELAGGGKAVLDQAVVGELGEFLDPDAGVAQDLDDGPGPERVVLLAGQVPPFPAAGLLGPGAGRRVGQAGSAELLAPGGERLAGSGFAGGAEPGRGVRAVAVGGGGEGRQGGKPLAGPGVHPGLGSADLLLVLDVAAADGAGHCPRSPAGGVVQGPPGEVEVEPADDHQDVVG
jgi:hypothetical protein